MRGHEEGRERRGRVERREVPGEHSCVHQGGSVLQRQVAVALPRGGLGVLMYEMLIFGGVWMTFFAFLGLSGLFKKRGALYSEKVSLDQVGILLELDDFVLEPTRELFKKHKVLEIREEVVKK